MQVFITRSSHHMDLMIRFASAGNAGLTRKRNFKILFIFKTVHFVILAWQKFYHISAEVSLNISKKVMKNVSSQIRAMHCSHTACISFWIPKRQAISTDTSFEIKMIMKIYAIVIIFKSHKPFQSYLLTGQADSANETGVSRNGLSLGYSEQDTSTV